MVTKLLVAGGLRAGVRRRTHARRRPGAGPRHSPSSALGFALGALAGGLAYCALFSLLSVLTRHAVVIGLVYLLIWEGLLGGLLDGVRWLSITRWAGAITDQVADLRLVNDLGLTYAVVAAVVVIVAGTWLTGSRLRGFNLTGDE